MGLFLIDIIEHESSGYGPRTKYNASVADVTLALAFDPGTHGEKLTKKYAASKYIGFQLSDDLVLGDIVKHLYGFMIKKKARTLNIAGNGIFTATKFGSTQRKLNLFVYRILEKLNSNYPIQRIYTGGQTGVDLAGGIAGHYLGIDTIMTLPKGFKQRFEDGKDIFQNQKDIVLQVGQWINILKGDMA